ncbi:MAG: dextranase [Thermoanaerobacter sp.]|nr:dextranase [Thermoanaerobacter sp.]
MSILESYKSVRLTDATIFAAGGDHIKLGDTGMLSKEYFPSANLKNVGITCKSYEKLV